MKVKNIDEKKEPLRARGFAITDFIMDRQVWEDQLAQKSVKFLVIGEEVAPTTKKKHWQISIWFEHARSVRKLRKLLSPRHIEVCRGNALQNKKYCEKDGNLVMLHGEPPEQGNRGDLEEIAEMLKNGEGVDKVAELYPGQYFRYHRGFEKFAEIFEDNSEHADYDLDSCCERLGVKPLDFEKSGTQVVIGPSGIGKTQWVLAHFENPLLVTHMDDLKGFRENKYDGIVFDDMCCKHLPRTAQIHLTDQEQSRSIHARYGNARIPKHTKKVFTCNEYCFIEDQAIERRVNLVELYGTEVGGNTRHPLFSETF